MSQEGGCKDAGGRLDALVPLYPDYLKFESRWPNKRTLLAANVQYFMFVTAILRALVPFFLGFVAVRLGLL